MNITINNTTKTAEQWRQEYTQLGAIAFRQTYGIPRGELERIIRIH